MLLTIEGNPIPCLRPKIKGKNFYDTQSKIKENYGWQVKSQLHPSFTPMSDPIHLRLEFYMPIPVSYSKKKKELLNGMFHFKKPDLSNLIKFVEDALNGIIWMDDRIITSINASKYYGKESKTVIYVKNM